VLLLLAAAASAYTLRGDFLPPGSDFGGVDRSLPILHSTPAGDEAALAGLGEALFASPDILGERARRSGVTCASCHLGGHRNARLLVPGYSAKRGSIDLTSDLFNPAADDHAFNPVDLSSLRGVAETAPYGRDGRFPDLRAFTRHVIVDELAGPEPDALVLDALVAFQRRIGFAPNRLLDAAGRLTPAASAAARRGARLFATPGARGPACAACHPPGRTFADGRSHDVGTGGTFESPTLRGLGQSAPYLHDGRFDTVAEAVAYFARWTGLRLSAADRRDLLAYVAAVGAADRSEGPVAAADQLDQIDRFAGALAGLAAEAAPALRFVLLDAAAAGLGRIAEHLSAPPAAPALRVVEGWAAALRAIERRAGEGDWSALGADLAAWRARIAAERADFLVLAAAGDYLRGGR